MDPRSPKQIPYKNHRYSPEYGPLPLKLSLLEKCPNTEFFWSVFSCIPTEYGDLSKSLYSVRIQENTDQKKLCIWTVFTQCITSHVF